MLIASSFLSFTKSAFQHQFKPAALMHQTNCLEQAQELIQQNPGQVFYNCG
jgi:hypothetical protein